MSKDDKILDLKIQSTRGTKVIPFPKETKVEKVIEEAVKEFGFTLGDKFELVLATNPGQPLQPDRTLVSYHLTDDMALILTAIGGGV